MNGTMFGDLDLHLNASCGFVSISWASCYCYDFGIFILLVWWQERYPDSKESSTISVRKVFGRSMGPWLTLSVLWKNKSLCLF